MDQSKLLWVFSDDGEAKAEASITKHTGQQRKAVLSQNDQSTIFLLCIRINILIWRHLLD